MNITYVIVNIERSLFDTRNPNKENFSNINNKGSVINTGSSFDYRENILNTTNDIHSNEIYQSMQGFLKPRVCKYSSGVSTKNAKGGFNMEITQVSCGESHMAFITE